MVESQREECKKDLEIVQRNRIRSTKSNLQINPAFFQPDGTNRLALSLDGAPDDQRLLLSMLNAWTTPCGRSRNFDSENELFVQVFCPTNIIIRY